MEFNTTTMDAGHVHTWKDGAIRTDVKMMHSHPINLKRMLAEKGTSDHTHKLIRDVQLY